MTNHPCGLCGHMHFGDTKCGTGPNFNDQVTPTQDGLPPGVPVSAVRKVECADCLEAKNLEEDVDPREVKWKCLVCHDFVCEGCKIGHRSVCSQFEPYPDPRG